MLICGTVVVSIGQYCDVIIQLTGFCACRQTEIFGFLIEFDFEIGFAISQSIFKKSGRIKLIFE